METGSEGCLMETWPRRKGGHGGREEEIDPRDIWETEPWSLKIGWMWGLKREECVIYISTLQRCNKLWYHSLNSDHTEETEAKSVGHSHR